VDDRVDSISPTASRPETAACDCFFTGSASNIVLEAERKALNQVRHHYLSRQLVLNWVRNAQGTPRVELDQLMHRMRVVG
jgi:hypothetical protein